MVRIEPSHSVVYDLKSGALVEINQGKDHRSQRGQRQYDRPQARSQVLPHKSTGPDYPRRKKPSATQCPLFGSESSEEHLYIQ